MPSRHSLSTSLTASLHDFIEALVASGRFGSASEVVRARLTLLERDLGSPAGVGAGRYADVSADHSPGFTRPPRTP